MKKFLSISLVFLLLSSHMSLAVGTHFCGGLAVKTEWMIGHAHLDCGMAMDVACSGADDQRTLLKASPCCENQYTTFEVGDEFNPAELTNNLYPDFAAIFPFSLLQDCSAHISTSHGYSDYSPPPLERDIPVLFQTFLI